MQAKGISIYARQTRYDGNRDVPPILARAEYATCNGRVNLSFREQPRFAPQEYISQMFVCIRRPSLARFRSFKRILGFLRSSHPQEREDMYLTKSGSTSMIATVKFAENRLIACRKEYPTSYRTQFWAGCDATGSYLTEARLRTQIPEQ